MWNALTQHLFLDRQAAVWMREIDATWSLSETRARIVEIVAETPDAKTFVLRPSRRFAGFRAGQYVPVDVEIEGKRVRRCYSISSAPRADRGLPSGGRAKRGRGQCFTITVKRVAGGVVSTWLHDHAAVGDVVGIGEAAGDFVLPETAPNGFLFLTAGSGITPVFSLLEELASRGALESAVLVDWARSAADVIFRARLAALAERHPGFRAIFRFTRGPGASPRFGEDDLRALVPDFAEREAFLCGPTELTDAAERVWDRLGIAARLRRERFVAKAPIVVAGASLDARVTLRRSGRSFATDGRATLLDESERAGASPAFGCRMGICHTCKCRKTSGTVENVLTGEASSAPDEDIQLCISVARSDVEIDL